MRKSVLFIILVAGCTLHSFAQTDATNGKSEQSYDQTVGVQLNDLIKQVLNFNNSTSTTPVNPYLLTYSINSHKTGWGLRFGVGYNYSSTSSDDGITAASTQLNDLALRLGIEKSFKLSDKWSAGVGIDAIFNSNNDVTSTTVESGDTTTTATKTVIFSYGGGPMAWLRYHVTDKILIGTEASFYYETGTQNNTVDVTTTSSFGGGGSVTTTTETDSKPTVSQGTFTSPVVFFIMVKF
jgi:hypothetical protein